MKRYIRSAESASEILDIQSFAQSKMKELGGSTNCKSVSDAIENKYGLKSVRVYIFNEGSQSNNSHWCNLSSDPHYLYDFTGDQFVGDDKSSKVWRYYKDTDSDIYVSKDRQTSSELSRQYPDPYSIIDKTDGTIFGIQLHD